jgi:hypothetical protein
VEHRNATSKSTENVLTLTQWQSALVKEDIMILFTSVLYVIYTGLLVC